MLRVSLDRVLHADGTVEFQAGPVRVEADSGVIASVGPRGLVELLDSGGNVIRAAVADNISFPEPGAGPPDDSPESVLARRQRAESHPPGVYWSVRMLDPGAYSCIRVRHLGVTVAQIVPTGEGYSVEIVHPRRLPLRPREHVTPADSPAPQGGCVADHSRRDAMKRLRVLMLRYRLFDDAFEVDSIGTNRESLPGPDGTRLEFLDAEGRVLRSASAYFRSPMTGSTPSDAGRPQASTGTQTHPVVDSASFTIMDPPDYSCIRFRYAHADGDTVAQVVPR